MNIPLNIFLLARKYKIGKEIIKISKNKFNLAEFYFKDEKIFEIDNIEPDISIDELTNLASLVKMPIETSRTTIPVIDDYVFVLPDINFFSAGKLVSIPFILEEDEDFRNQRIHFIQSVMEFGISREEALEYSYYHANDIFYGTRYNSVKENRLDFLRSLL